MPVPFPLTFLIFDDLESLEKYWLGILRPFIGIYPKTLIFLMIRLKLIGFWEKLSCHFHHIISKEPFYDLSDIDVGHLAEIVFVRLFHYKIMILIY